MHRTDEDPAPSRGTSIVLLLVSTPVERAAVLAAVRSVTGHDPTPWFLQSQTVLRLGRISGTEVYAGESSRC